MQTRIRFLFGLVLCLYAAAAPAEGGIHYVGFNRFLHGQETEAGASFDRYINRLRPIMARYGMTLEVYDVVHGGTDALPASVVTFGSARDQASFQAFFQDEEFREIFPTLVGALDDHHVVFTAEKLAPAGAADAHTLLSLAWMKADPATGVARIERLNAAIAPVFDTYGVRQLGYSAGLESNRGLADQVVQTTPPDLLELWAIRDAHGFFDDPLVKAAAGEADALISRSLAFWLRPRDIR